MNEIGKQILIALGLTAGGTTDLPTIDFYKHELQIQSKTENELIEEIKLLEYKKKYDDVTKKNMDFVKKWDKYDTKTENKLEDNKSKLKDTREVIKKLKEIVKEDSLRTLPPKIETL